MTSNLVDDFAAALGSMTPVLLRAVEAMLPFAALARRYDRLGKPSRLPGLPGGRGARAKWAMRIMDNLPSGSFDPASDREIGRYMRASRYRRRIDPRRWGFMSKNRRFIDTSAGHVEGVDG